MTLAPVVPPAIVLVVLAAERRLIARLRQARATVPERAVRLETQRLSRRRLAHLVRVGAVREIADGRHYLDEAVYTLYCGHRRRMVIIAVVAAVLALGAVMLLFGR